MPSLQKSLARCIEALPYVLVGSVLIYQIHQPVIWDSSMYLHCIDLVREGQVDHLSCFGHPSQAYIGLLSLGWIMGSGNIIAIRIVSLVLLMGFVWSVGTVLRLLLPKQRVEMRTLAVTAIVSSSVLVSNITQINSDIGVLCGTTMVLAFLMRKEYVLAACAGTLLLFSKEVGLLIYTAMIGLFVLTDICRAKVVLPKKLRMLVHALTPLLVPLLLLGVYLAIRIFILQRPAFFDFGGWEQEWQGKLPQMFLSIDLTSRWLWMALAAPLALQFMWIQTAFTVVAIFIACACFAFRQRMRGAKVVHHHVFLIAILALFGMYITTRYPLFNNPRYLLFIYPLTGVLFVSAVEYLFSNISVKKILFVTVIILNLLSWQWSLDPISRYIYGTISVGGKAFYPIASASHDRCCGHGRDQLIYNFQFLDLIEIGRAAREVAVALPSRTIIVDPGSQFTFWPEGFSVPEPVWKEEKEVKYVTTEAALANPAAIQDAVYVEYPHMPDGKKQELLNMFPQHEKKVLTRNAVPVELYIISKK